MRVNEHLSRNRNRDVDALVSRLLVLQEAEKNIKQQNSRVKSMLRSKELTAREMADERRFRSHLTQEQNSKLRAFRLLESWRRGVEDHRRQIIGIAENQAAEIFWNGRATNLDHELRRVDNENAKLRAYLQSLGVDPDKVPERDLSPSSNSQRRSPSRAGVVQMEVTTTEIDLFDPTENDLETRIASSYNRQVTPTFLCYHSLFPLKLQQNEKNGMTPQTRLVRWLLRCKGLSSKHPTPQRRSPSSTPPAAQRLLVSPCHTASRTAQWLPELAVPWGV